MMLMALLHSLGQDDQYVVQHDFFGHVIPLEPEPASYDVNGIFVLLRSR